MRGHLIRTSEGDWKSYEGYAGVSDYLQAVSRGLVPGASVFGAFGRMVTSGAVTNTLIWPDGALNVPAVAGVQMTFASTSDQDGLNGGGTGIRALHVHYLDSSLAEKEEIVTLNGTNNVLSVALDIRWIQCMHLETFGSSKAAVGIITAKNNAITYSQLAAGDTRCTSSARMVPAGKRLMVQALSGGAVSGTAAASAQLFFGTSVFGGRDYTQDGILIPIAAQAAQDSGTALSIPIASPFEAGTLVGMLGTVDKAAILLCSWFGWLEPV